MTGGRHLGGANQTVRTVGTRLAGHWINDAGTVIELLAHDDGRVSGSIRFGADGHYYRPHAFRGTSVTRPGSREGVVGTILDWPIAEATVVWCGEVDDRGQMLSTYLLTASGPGGPGEWTAAAGGGAFRRMT